MTVAICLRFSDQISAIVVRTHNDMAAIAIHVHVELAVGDEPATEGGATSSPLIVGGGALTIESVW